MAKTVYATGVIPTAANFNAFTQEANAAVTGGTINGAVVGGVTPAAGSFTTLATSGNVTLGDASTDTLNVGNGGIFKDASGNVGIGTTSPSVKLDVVGAIAASTTIKTGGYTVATLPAAGTAGRMAYVTDATLPTYNAALVGGGAVVVPVFDNGVAWTSH